MESSLTSSTMISSSEKHEVSRKNKLDFILLQFLEKLAKLEIEAELLTKAILAFFWYLAI